MCVAGSTDTHSLLPLLIYPGEGEEGEGMEDEGLAREKRCGKEGGTKRCEKFKGESGSYKDLELLIGLCLSVYLCVCLYVSVYFFLFFLTPSPTHLRVSLLIYFFTPSVAR